ncbi:kinase-like domain-containing protein [Mycena floridula]|nr:kinase-like domain-containing protein [Mycena floridula]
MVSKFLSNLFTSNPKSTAPVKTTVVSPLSSTLVSENLEVLKLLQCTAKATRNTYLVRHIPSQQLFALKAITKGCMTKLEIEELMDQQRIHAELSCIEGTNGFIPALRSTWYENGTFFQLMDHVPGIDLAVLLLSENKFLPSRVRGYVAEMILALEILHSRKIVHRDVTLLKFRVDSSGHIVLTDLGSPKDLSPDDVVFDVSDDADAGSFYSEPRSLLTDEQSGSSLFACPEQLHGEAYSFDADLWGLGVCIIKMLTGRMPFETDEEVDQKVWIMQGGGVDHVTEALVRRLLAKNRCDRMDLKQLKEHPYFHGLDWRKVKSRMNPVSYFPFISSAPKVAGADYHLFDKTCKNNDLFPEFRWEHPKLPLSSMALAVSNPSPVTVRNSSWSLQASFFTASSSPVPKSMGAASAPAATIRTQMLPEIFMQGQHEEEAQRSHTIGRKM